MANQGCAVAALALVLASVFVAPAAATERMVGSFLVTEEEDPFSKQRRHIVATVARGGHVALAFRCFGHDLSIVLVVGREGHGFEAGDAVAVEWVADSGEVRRLRGSFFGDTLIGFDGDPDQGAVLAAAIAASQLAFRYADELGSVETVQFSMKKSGAALAALTRDCTTTP